MAIDKNFPYKEVLCSFNPELAESNPSYPSTDHMKEALTEAMKRYPDAIDALAWFGIASGLSQGRIEQEHLDWANDVMSKREGMTDEKGNIVL